MARSFDISKQVVWQAYKQVKANKGAEGVDEQTIQDLEKDLKGNLYKLWNRMTSGRYFPPPVKAVAIPKKAGGARNLGIPCVSDKPRAIQWSSVEGFECMKSRTIDLLFS